MTTIAQLSMGVQYDYGCGKIIGDLRIVPLAHALAGINRYGAWPAIYWSVASHACLVAEILAATTVGAGFDHLTAVLGGLHHDDDEALTGDKLTPFKNAWSDAMYNEWVWHARRARRALVRALGIFEFVPLEIDSPATRAIAAADLAALEAERRWLFAERLTWGTEDVVDPRMLEVGERIIARRDFSGITGGRAAAERFVEHHNALLQRIGANA